MTDDQLTRLHTALTAATAASHAIDSAREGGTMEAIEDAIESARSACALADETLAQHGIVVFPGVENV